MRPKKTNARAREERGHYDFTDCAGKALAGGIAVMGAVIGVPWIVAVAIDWCGLRRRISNIGRTHAKRAFDAADDAANRAADHPAGGACGLPTDRGAMRHAVGNSLGLRRKRRGK